MYELSNLSSSSTVLADDDSDGHILEADEKLLDVEEREVERNGALDLLEEPHSVFDPVHKKLIVLTASTAALLSPLSSNIYLPALNLIAEGLDVTDSQINLTVTSYLVFQAISPMVIAGFSDQAGRRPAYLACFSLYLVANIALTLQSNYWALLVLRCLQSAGSSALVALCQGIVADVATAADRGSYVAYASVSIVLGPSLSPVLGGFLAQYFGWRAIFAFLACFGATTFAIIILFLPETCRRVVGNGSITPPRTIHLTLPGWLRTRRRYGGYVAVGEQMGISPASIGRLRFPNPLQCLNILLNIEALLLMCFVGGVFALHYLILSVIPSHYSKVYGLRELSLSLVYISYGLGSILSALTTGRLANWNYQRHSREMHFRGSTGKRGGLIDFPLERARLEIALPVLYAGSAFIALYGWLLSLGTHRAGPLNLLFGIGYTVYALHQITSLLILGIFPEKPATATAANNLIRCSFAALSVAGAVPFVDWLGVGWAYTTAAVIAVLMSSVLWSLIVFGPRWRLQHVLANRMVELSSSN
ncbi:MAG: hypothetical protein Q9169_005393 [Polycauliona sp. 2 TL-2023]